MNDAGRISEEGLARLRARVGIPEPHTAPPRYLRADTDAFRHVAQCYGDDNPLWCDPAYAESSRWKGSIAPPPLVGGDSLIGEDEIVEVAPEHRELMQGDPLRGVHAFYAATAREWWSPLRPATRVWRRNALVAAQDKASEFAGRAIHEWTAHVFRADDGTLLSAQLRDMVRTERAEARARKKEVALEPRQWSEDELAELDAQYAREAPRGPEPRWWEDVDEGDELAPIVKGPLTVTDMVCWHTGMGMGMYHVRPLRLAWKNRQRIPRFYHRDDLGIPDVLQRVHWDPAYARKSGNPTTFDYGRMRETWLTHLCTDWMGDDGWLWHLDCEFRKFNYVGDAHWMRGRVVRKYLAEGDRPAVDLDLRGENQRGEITTPGHATVLLPSREHGEVRLPDPPGGATDLQGALSAISEQFAQKG
jgi:acyl dehydratase